MGWCRGGRRGDRGQRECSVSATDMTVGKVECLKSITPKLGEILKLTTIYYTQGGQRTNKWNGQNVG